MRAEIALMSGSAFAVTHHAFSSGAGRTSDGNGSHASTLKSPSYTKSVSWQHYPITVSLRMDSVYGRKDALLKIFELFVVRTSSWLQSKRPFLRTWRGDVVTGINREMQ